MPGTVKGGHGERLWRAVRLLGEGRLWLTLAVALLVLPPTLGAVPGVIFGGATLLGLASLNPADHGLTLEQLQHLSAAASVEVGAGAMGLATLVLSVWGGAAFIWHAGVVRAGGSAGLMEALVQGARRWVADMILAVQLIVITVVGLALLVIPGVYWAVLYLFAPVIRVLDHHERHPLRRSAELVRGGRGQRGVWDVGWRAALVFALVEGVAALLAEGVHFVPIVGGLAAEAVEEGAAAIFELYVLLLWADRSALLGAPVGNPDRL